MHFLEGVCLKEIRNAVVKIYKVVTGCTYYLPKSSVCILSLSTSSIVLESNNDIGEIIYLWPYISSRSS